MALYVKKPIPVEAVQFTDGPHNREDLIDFTQNHIIFQEKNGIKHIVIPTLEGDMCAPVGCYVVKGPHGEFYPVQQDIFEEMYEIYGNNNIT